MLQLENTNIIYWSNVIQIAHYMHPRHMVFSMEYTHQMYNLIKMNKLKQKIIGENSCMD